MPMKQPYGGAWWLYAGVTADQLGAKLGEHGACIADLEAFIDNGALKFTAVLSKNNGVAHWWYFGLTGDQVGAKLTEHGAVPVCLSAYGEGANMRFAVAMQKRPGTTYWWYFGLTADALGEKLAAHEAMPVEIAPTMTDAGLRFAAVMVPRGRSASWWWFGQTIEDVSTRLQETGGQIDLLRAYAASGGTRFVVAIKKPAAPPAWWYFGQTVEDIFQNARREGSYVSDLTTYRSGAARLYACVMHPRSFVSDNPARHARIRDMLGATHTGGWHGFYLKRIGGRVMQAFNEKVVFDPASSIKALVHATALKGAQDRMVIEGSVVTLDTTVKRPNDTGCPFNEVNTPENTLPLPLSRALESMMRPSRNAPTEAIRRMFGPTRVSATAVALGMVDTRYGVAPGCGRNETTLVDLGELYERCSRDYLDAARWSAFREHALGAPLDELIDICRADSVDAGLPTTFVDRYRRRMRGVHKAGRGGDAVEKASVAGYVSIPFCEGGKIVDREYVYGVFVDHADPAKLDDAFNQNRIAGEMLRDEIGASVDSFARGRCAI